MDVDRLLYWFLTRSVTEKLFVMALFVLLVLGGLLLVILVLNALVTDMTMGIAPIGPIVLYFESGI